MGTTEKVLKYVINEENERSKYHDIREANRLRRRNYSDIVITNVEFDESTPVDGDIQSGISPADLGFWKNRCIT